MPNVDTGLVKRHKSLLLILFTAAGPILGALGYAYSVSAFFWIGTVFCFVNLLMNIASGILKFPVLPVGMMIAGTIFLQPWYVGLAAGLFAWTALESIGELYAAFRSAIK